MSLYSAALLPGFSPRPHFPVLARLFILGNPFAHALIGRVRLSPTFFKRREGKMKGTWLLCVALAISLGIILVAGYPVAPSNEEYVLVNNKCQCVTVTSKFVPSKEDPQEEVLERNIRIIVPLKARENISDPLSPLRTTFVYRLSELCKNCEPIEIDLGGAIHQAQQGNSCEEAQTCYTYDRNECYSSPVPLLYHGEVMQVPAALTPDSCFAQ